MKTSYTDSTSILVSKSSFEGTLKSIARLFLGVFLLSVIDWEDMQAADSGTSSQVGNSSLTVVEQGFRG